MKADLQLYCAALWKRRRSLSPRKRKWHQVRSTLNACDACAWHCPSRGRSSRTASLRLFWKRESSRCVLLIITTMDTSPWLFRLLSATRRSWEAPRPARI